MTAIFFDMWVPGGGGAVTATAGGLAGGAAGRPGGVGTSGTGGLEGGAGRGGSATGGNAHHIFSVGPSGPRKKCPTAYSSNFILTVLHQAFL